MRFVYKIKRTGGNLVGYELGLEVGAEIVDSIEKRGFVYVLLPDKGIRVSATFALGVVDRLREYIGEGVDIYKYVDFVGDERLVRVFEEAYDYSIWSSV